MNGKHEVGARGGVVHPCHRGLPALHPPLALPPQLLQAAALHERRAFHPNLPRRAPLYLQARGSRLRRRPGGRSRAGRGAGGRGAEEVPKSILVQLQHRALHSHLQRALQARGVQLLHGAWQQARRGRSTQDGVRLPGPSLAIGEDADVVTVESRAHQGAALLKHVLLRGCRAEARVELVPPRRHLTPLPLGVGGGPGPRPLRANLRGVLVRRRDDGRVVDPRGRLGPPRGGRPHARHHPDIPLELADLVVELLAQHGLSPQLQGRVLELAPYLRQLDAHGRGIPRAPGTQGAGLGAQCCSRLLRLEEPHL
mmetsp:Transcript_28538/g.90948  ORF Transcript_28538/g.90948 Transcript_28538/m.90948 type:complete len:311 (-) Transcript_28538:40-972(-)